MIIYNLTERMLHRLLMETIEEGYDKEMEERERLLDYFEGINLEHDIKDTLIVNRFHKSHLCTLILYETSLVVEHWYINKHQYDTTILTMKSLVNLIPL